VTGLVVPRCSVRVSSGYFYSLARCAPTIVMGEGISSAAVNTGAAWVFIGHIECCKALSVRVALAAEGLARGDYCR